MQTKEQILNNIQEKLKEFHTKLGIISVEFQGNPNFNSIKLLTKGITTTITEDGIILLMVDSIDNINQNLKNLEEFFSRQIHDFVLLNNTFLFLFPRLADSDCDDQI